VCLNKNNLISFPLTAKVEKTIASEIVNNEVNIENDVNKKLNGIIEQQIQVVQKQKRVVAKCHQDNEAAKVKHQVRISFNYNSFFFFWLRKLK
jgi:glucose-6-phosphate-specific signal transduction histidine kinase